MILDEMSVIFKSIFVGKLYARVYIWVCVENMLGKGGHAEVYKGCLPDGRIVAVKRLMRNEKEIEDTVGDFLTELGIIAHINNPNATRLIGFGIDQGLFFVLQLAPHGSLASMLFGAPLNPSLLFSSITMNNSVKVTWLIKVMTSNISGPECLEWNIRFKVAVGVAKGLHYLHHDCPRRIIHRDIKASNILLNHSNEAEVN